MAAHNGKDDSRDLRRQIKRETATQKYLFGTVVGTQDAGHRSLTNPAPVGGHLEGADPMKIKLRQMQQNHADAMASLMIPAPTNERQSKLVDLGMGRLSDGRERPIQSWVDETIKIKKD